ncbi:MAG: M23 family metallopeptidase [Rikenellaceae bacterium]
MGKRSRISQLRRRKRVRRNIFRLLLRALVWAGVAVLYYVGFSLFFDTPLESHIKESNLRLRAEYTRLHGRYDSLNMATQSVVERDNGIFKTLFDSTPYDFDSGYEQQKVATYEYLLSLSNEELAEYYNRSLSELEQNTQKLTKGVDRLSSKLSEMGDSLRSIPAIQPIVNDQLTLLTASYGMRMHPFYKRMYSHQGVDYTIPEGTRVFATADGVVKSVSLKNSTQGKQIVIDHGNGYETSYSHLALVDIPRYRRVKRGDIIGLSGNTGLSLTPHLHYEVRYNGTRVDPVHYFFGELTPLEYQRMLRIAQSGMQSFD